MSAWIKCSERLPEKFEPVLVFESVHQMVRIGMRTSMIAPGGSWIVGSDPNTPVSHWMPLPEPPSEQAAEEKCNR